MNTDDTGGADPSLRELIQRGDPAALLTAVDRRCSRRDWDGLVALRDRCEAAVEFGKQLWPVAQFAEYRLALEAPGPYAGDVCRTGAAKFALGPLTEVAASTHRWEELADHLAEPWIAATVAHERLLRGDEPAGDPRANGQELDVPLTLLDVEPDYPVATYRAYELLEGGTEPVDAQFDETDGVPGRSAERPRLERALRDVVATWTERSNGGANIAVTEGDAAGAGAAVADGPVRMAPVAAGDVLARLAWTAASGGALGQRRGMAAGRSTALWVLTVAGDLDYDADPAEMSAAARRLDWYLLDTDVVARDASSKGGDGGAAPNSPEPVEASVSDDSGGGRARGGWRLQIALEDPGAGWAAAVDAWDRPLEGTAGTRQFTW